MLNRKSIHCFMKGNIMQQIKNIVLERTLPFLLGVVVTVIAVALLESSCSCGEKLVKQEKDIAQVRKVVEGLNKKLDRVSKTVANIEKVVVGDKATVGAKADPKKTVAVTDAKTKTTETSTAVKKK